jgi:hypothetical protein
MLQISLGHWRIDAKSIEPIMTTESVVHNRFAGSAAHVTSRSKRSFRLLMPVARSQNRLLGARLALLTAFVVLPGVASRADDTADLTQQVQNPVAKLISVPFQNNSNFGVGPNGGVQDVLNIEPIVPFKVTDNWNVVTRTIIPLIHQPGLAPGVGNTSGLGDILFTPFLSPAKTDSIIWGIGPAFQFASANKDIFGQGKFATGLSAAALTIQGHWVIGGLVNDLVSVAGVSYRKNVHQMLVQPFVDYNFSHGWYLTSSPIVTADWKASSGNRWTVPLGGGIGKIFSLGNQHMNAGLQAFDDVVHAHEAGNWTLRVELQLLFPK